ncbi:hypothetical protein GPOL_c10940 [Gordonia polyisoprenivorans VH2]|uniref:TPR repeat domain-containing protein n=1 Tax=Gordonia polyisoprenivorans (strain DSM 44266 / VH2) TaxID=1112204 RepID=H6N1E5_GORPV|nr:hypothetical protein [Gordonia polyisoprenivorans]AFA72156.1 hypothetical protein GPOL_c10940 [Gordonia polyisoprenivorans VH2]
MICSLTKSEVLAYDASPLLDLAGAWTAMGSGIEDLFTRYRSTVAFSNGTHWTGAAADAAVARAESDLRASRTVAQTLTDLADQATQGYWSIDAPLRRARDAIATAEASGFTVDEYLTAHPRAVGPMTVAVRNAIVTHTQAITRAVADVITADTDVRNSLAGMRSGLIAGFTSADSVGSPEGGADGRALATDPSTLSPEALRRLVEAGRLDPQQVAALEAGAPVTISASHMEYMNTLLRGLDGKSPQEIEAILGALPPEAQRGLVNIMQISSHHDVTAGVTGDPEVPTTGGLAVLPAQMRASLTRKDLFVVGTKNTPGYPGSSAGGNSYSLNGVADNQAISRIVGMGERRYGMGTDLDHALMTATKTYLHGQVLAEQDPNSPSYTVDGRGRMRDESLTTGMIAALSSDTIAVNAAVADPQTGMQFVTDILTHRWDDDGRNAALMFTFADTEMRVENAGDPLDVIRATRAGDIMESVARATASDAAWKLMSAIPNTDGQSVGEVNPKLVHGLSLSMGEYLPDLVGTDEHPGFDVKSLERATLRGASNIIATLNTDPQAGEAINSRIMLTQLELERDFGQNPDANEKLITAGRLEGILDAGTTLATLDEYGHEAAADAYQRKYESVDQMLSLLSTAGGYVPFGEDATGLADATGATDAFKKLLIDPPPDTSPSPDGHGNQPHLNGDNSNTAIYNVLSGMGPLPPHVAAAGGDFVDPETGRIKPYTVIDTGENDATVLCRLEEMLKALAGEDAIDYYRTGYQKVNP